MNRDGAIEPPLEALLALARKRGADAADVLAVSSVALSVTRRLGRLETLERAAERRLGLRVLIGRQQAMVSSGDWSPSTLETLCDRALAMARAAPEDPYGGLAAPEQLFQGQLPDLDLEDQTPPPDADALLARAAAAEEAALAVPAVVNSQGAEASWSRRAVTLAASNGFRGHHIRTAHSLSVVAVAQSDAGMETDYEWRSVVHGADLPDPAPLGRRAGERAVARLNPRQGKTARLPVVFAPQVAGTLVRSLAQAANGAAIARGSSFLKESLGQRIMAPGLTVIDDPRRRRGLASRPFDDEGLATARRALVEDGVLTSWLLDLRAGRQLGLPSSSAASRGITTPPTPAASNLFLAPGAVTPEALLEDIGDGVYITTVMGMGVNIVTGDYSQGAAGIWIENGRLSYPVSGITVAGRLQDMWRTMTAANDLEFHTGIDAPTLRIEGMTIAASG